MAQAQPVGVALTPRSSSKTKPAKQPVAVAKTPCCCVFAGTAARAVLPALCQRTLCARQLQHPTRGPSGAGVCLRGVMGCPVAPGCGRQLLSGLRCLRITSNITAGRSEGAGLVQGLCFALPCLLEFSQYL